jgi:hypothetical protein
MVRFSWSTTREALTKLNAAVVKWECEEEDNGNMDITSFFVGKDKKRPRSSYFTKRQITRTTLSSIS